MLYRKRRCRFVIFMFSTFLVFHIFLAIWGKFRELVWARFPVIIHWPPVDTNIQCYGVVEDALQSVDDPDFSPKSKSIFFHETSCRGGITSRQACAVESAARAHLDWEVYLLFTAPVADIMLKRSCLVALLQFPNIKLARIHVDSYTRGTIVQKIVSEKLQKSLEPVKHTADIMKILTLHKWGGVNIDLDVLVMRSFTCLPNNWIAKESPFLLASGIMRFSKDAVGHNFTKKVLSEIAFNYNSESPSYNGASAIERVLKRRCRRSLLKTGHCRGISIYGPKRFYPIIFSSAPLMLEEGPDPRDQIKHEPYTYCMWDDRTSFLKVHQNSSYVKMAKKVCPTIYKMFGDEFGV